MAAPYDQTGYAQEVVLAKAAEVCGGLTNLAYILDKSSEDLSRWITGSETVPEDVIREAFAVITSIAKQAAA